MISRMLVFEKVKPRLETLHSWDPHHCKASAAGAGEACELLREDGRCRGFSARDVQEHCATFLMPPKSSEAVSLSAGSGDRAAEASNLGLPMEGIRVFAAM